VSGDYGVEEGIDGGKGSGVGMSGKIIINYSKL
jgi:hypothetical protein